MPAKCLRGNRKSNIIFLFLGHTARSRRKRARPFILLNARAKLMARDIRIFACEIATIFLSEPSALIQTALARRRNPCLIEI